MVVEKLYQPKAVDVSHEFVFSDEVIRSALRRIYKGDIDLLRDIEENLFGENWRVLNEAAESGYVSHSPDDDFLEIIKSNNAVFSAFKVHRLQNDIATQLMDSNGVLKPFERFAKDVEPITDHHCKRWLRTEYDTAVLRSHKATQWQQFLREADDFPNIRWLPSTAINPREEHRVFWGLVLPIEHPFWQQHQPGDDWNCQCDWESTDDKPTELPKERLGLNPAKGLEGNPGVTGKLFSDNHPYVTNGYNGSKEAVRKFIVNLLEKEFERKRKEAIADVKSWCKSNLPTVRVGKFIAKRFLVENDNLNIPVIIKKSFYDEVMTKYKDDKLYIRKILLSKDAHILFKDAKYIRTEISIHHADAIFKVFELQRDSDKVIFKCKVNKDGAFLHYMWIE